MLKAFAVAYNDKRNTVRIASKDEFSSGSVWVADMLHVPFGVSCSILLHEVLLFMAGI